jgi:hypothetical protein
MLFPAAAGLLDAVGNEASAQHSKAGERKRWTCPVPAEALAAPIVLGRDADAGVEIELSILDGVRFTDGGAFVDGGFYSRGTD